MSAPPTTTRPIDAAPSTGSSSILVADVPGPLAVGVRFTGHDAREVEAIPGRHGQLVGDVRTTLAAIARTVEDAAVSS